MKRKAREGQNRREHEFNVGKWLGGWINPKSKHRRVVQTRNCNNEMPGESAVEIFCE